MGMVVPWLGRCLLLAVVCGCVCGGWAASLHAASEEPPIRLEADHLDFDEQSGTYRARGNVLLERGGYTLRSESVDYDAARGVAQARGSVHFDAPEGTLDGSELYLHLDTGRGTVKDGRLWLRDDNFRASGRQIVRTGAQSFFIEDGRFTTCDADPPPWQIGAGSMAVTIGSYARVRHARFYLSGLPLLYSPYLLFPVKTERESGLLTPSFGYSDRRGFQADLAWFQVLARNQDATFYLDYLSELGVGKGVEYRYVFDGDNRGEALFYHVSGLQDADDRYAVDWLHGGDLPGGVRLSADVEYVSERDYFEDFGQVAEEYNKDLVQSTLAAARQWGALNVTGLFEYTKDLEQNNEQTLQRLPEVRLDLLRQRFGTSPFYYDIDGSATRFWRREGLTGDRFILRPSLAAVWKPGDLLEIEPEIGYTGRAYRTSSEGPGEVTHGIYDLSTRVSTRLERIYAPQSGRLQKLRHSIEPDVVYRFIPEDDQEDLPSFDAADRILATNQLSYGVTNRFTGRLQEAEGGAPVYHDYLYLRLSQEFDIREARREQLSAEDHRTPFSALRLEATLRPTLRSYLDLDLRYDANRDVEQITVLNADAGTGDARGNAVDFGYRYSQESLEYLSGHLQLALLKPVYLDYLNRYDLRENTQLEQVIGAEYRSQCWSLFLTYRDRLEDREIMVSFALSGLGRVGGLSSSLGTAGQATP